VTRLQSVCLHFWRTGIWEVSFFFLLSVASSDLTSASFGAVSDEQRKSEMYVAVAIASKHVKVCVVVFCFFGSDMRQCASLLASLEPCSGWPGELVRRAREPETTSEVPVLDPFLIGSFFFFCSVSSFFFELV
jgi:hypothetical protein